MSNLNMRIYPSQPPTQLKLEWGLSLAIFSQKLMAEERTKSKLVDTKLSQI